jgi:hypothetical protein
MAHGHSSIGQMVFQSQKHNSAKHTLPFLGFLLFHHFSCQDFRVYSSGGDSSTKRIEMEFGIERVAVL